MWGRFRGWPLWVQIPLWIVAWPIVGALALLARPRRSAWQLVAAVVLLVAVTPAWGVALIAPQAGEQRAAAGDEGPDAADPPATDEPGAAEGHQAGEDDAHGRAEDPDDRSATPDDPEDASATSDEQPEEAGETPAEDAEGATVAAEAPSGDLEVHFLDVGQGDATLLLHDDVTVLIDTGHWQRSDVVPYLRAQGVDRLDLVIVTHPHADHIGQFAQVVDAFPVDEVWWSGSETTTQTFSRAVDALDRSRARYEEPRAGDATSIGPLRFDVVNPPPGTGLADLHDASLGIRVSYGEVAFLFTGDAEAAAEQRMASAGDGIRSDVLQVGHHGSSTSTVPAFLAAADPRVAVYSAGAGNSYGHPHAEVIDRLAAADVDTYGTDVHGHVIVVTDGESLAVTAQRSGTIAAPAPGGSGNTQARAPPPAEETGEEPGEGSAAPGPGCGPGQVDINAAGVVALQEIIHIGPARAEDLVTMRPFSSVDSLTRVSGIADARIADIKEQGIACVG